MSMTSGKRRCLALWFPYLSIERLRKRESASPTVTIEKVRGALRLVAVDAHAKALGFAPGLALADARALCPDLHAVPADPQADAEWLERLAKACGHYTPLVALHAPDGLLLDITGCAHLFGGEAGLIADIAARMAGQKLCVRLARGSTPEAARALALYGEGRDEREFSDDESAAIRRLPVAALGLDGDATRALQRAGLKTIGDLAARPLAPLAARFGEEAVTALRRLLGEEAKPLAPLRASPMVQAARRFAAPLLTTEAALAVLSALIEEARTLLEAHKKGGRAFSAHFFRSDGAVHELNIETSAPTRDVALLMRLFTERIEALRDPLDPGFGYDMIRLIVPRADPLAEVQAVFARPPQHQESVAALIDRLSIRLGRSNVVRLVPQDTHIPEQAQCVVAALDAAPLPWLRVVQVSRPLLMLDPPQRIEVIAGVPDGPPQRFRWRRDLHEVAASEGPERIAAEWWRRKPGHPGLTRDYYRIEDRQGYRFWVFRHGLYAEKPDPNWFIHGLFA